MNESEVMQGWYTAQFISKQNDVGNTIVFWIDTEQTYHRKSLILFRAFVDLGYRQYRATGKEWERGDDMQEMARNRFEQLNKIPPLEDTGRPLLF